MFMSRMLQSFADKYAFMEKKRTPDGAGGFNPVWEEGEQFDAIRQHDTTIEAQIADKNDTASTYAFLVDKGISIEAGDVIKCLKDGRIFLITSNSEDEFTPSTSALNMRKITAKRWELTK